MLFLENTTKVRIFFIPCHSPSAHRCRRSRCQPRYPPVHSSSSTTLARLPLSPISPPPALTGYRPSTAAAPRRFRHRRPRLSRRCRSSSSSRHHIAAIVPYHIAPTTPSSSRPVSSRPTRRARRSACRGATAVALWRGRRDDGSGDDARQLWWRRQADDGAADAGA